jgi:hypothetical protein
MEKKENLSLPIPRKYFIVLMYIFVSALILIAFTTYPGFNWYSNVMFADMVYGDAHKPFVYRTLVPSTVRAITLLTPQFLIDKIESIAKAKSMAQEMIYISDMDDEYIYEYLIALFIMLMCFVGFAYSIRQLIKIHYNFPDFIADLAPIGALIFIPAFFRYYNELYDPATLLLFASGLLMISQRKRFWFYIIFALATFNKETALLLSIPFIFIEWNNISKWKLISHLCLQFIVWLGAKAVVTYIFMDNPGPFITFNFIHHTLTLPTRPFPFFYMHFFFITFSILIRYYWRNKPVFLRRSFLISFIVLSIAGMLFGVIDEMRIFYEVYPLAFLLILPTITGVFGVVPVEDSQSGVLRG